MQQPPSLSPETLAAQTLGDVDRLSGGLTPAINPSTNYQQQPDGSTCPILMGRRERRHHYMALARSAR
jgi:hypothetical protein